ncbi:glycerophosphodiester phosphodiesterase family protein [Rhodovulum kholense]|uniref:Glycerophosphoryl diester phosphodiesterase n=1 Tax=Rhodovulum kholense TaxID=453584 RepID=A0A8E3APB9_9RHOB|nr:glycerophosphodiester phosphodiesterase family protein [Rhodovulum kholense]PTW44474.1 glycerophosphoryl diester phosphodiesterase [Rhodovulum kholense]
MKRTLGALALGLISMAPAHAATLYNTLDGEAPLIIAHRGASGYLPEHTLGGYELALQMGADVIEPDLQTTADGELVAMHDSTLNRTTNIEALFAPRNGGYRVSDFTLAEIKSLTVEPTGATASTSYDGFTPSMADPYKVPTFQEVMDLVSAYNATTGKQIGIYPEAKTPNSLAMNEKILQEMKANGFDGSVQNTFIQTFSHEGARQLADLQVEMGMDNAIAALGYAIDLGDGFGVYDATTGGVTALEDLAGFADGLGLYLGYDLDAAFIAAAHALGLTVHGWTFRPTSDEAAWDMFLPWIEAGMDGFFTDYSLRGVEVLDRYEASEVPVPATLPLMLAGLGGLAMLRRRRAAA